jgi:hypothetical protein
MSGVIAFMKEARRGPSTDGSGPMACGGVMAGDGLWWVAVGDGFGNEVRTGLTFLMWRLTYLHRRQ